LEPALLSSRSLTISALALSLLLGGCDRQSGGQAQGEPAAGTAKAPAGEIDRSHKGSELPDFTLRDPAGGEIQLRSLKGKPLLINLWATWCAPCVAELPALDRLAARGAIKVLTVSQDMAEPAKVAAFLKQRGATRIEPWLDPENNLAFHYGSQTLPTSILYDARGREVWRITGPREWDDAETQVLLDEVR
jgi:thiol-disulfide isomerase/thioredoxin